MSYGSRPPPHADAATRRGAPPRPLSLAPLLCSPGAVPACLPAPLAHRSPRTFAQGASRRGRSGAARAHPARAAAGARGGCPRCFPAARCAVRRVRTQRARSLPCRSALPPVPRARARSQPLLLLAGNYGDGGFMADSSSQQNADASGAMCPRLCLAPVSCPRLRLASVRARRRRALRAHAAVRACAGGKKRSGERGMLPVTIKQIIAAQQEGEEGCKVDGREANQVTFVGQIVNVKDSVRRARALRAHALPLDRCRWRVHGHAVPRVLAQCWRLRSVPCAPALARPADVPRWRRA